MSITRRQHRHFTRWRRQALIVGLSFAVGALADAALSWRLRELAPFGPALPVQTAPPEGLPPDGAGPARSAPSAKIGDSADEHHAVSGTTGLVSESAAIDALAGRDLLMPVLGVPPSALRDTYHDRRSGGRVHEALDIMAPRGTPVRAVEGGVVAKLFQSKAGGLTVYQFDPGTTYCYYYAHLDRYANGLQEGHSVVPGEVIGYVGSTGNASPDAPHLHFAVFRLGPERQWWKGEPIDPYPLLAR